MSDFKRFCELKASYMRAGMDEIDAHQLANDRMMEMTTWINTPDVDDSDFDDTNTEEEEND
jgi:hypothetical protein